MTELEFITKQELLKYHTKEIQALGKSQFIEIDDELHLIKDGEKCVPDIKISDASSIILISIKYHYQIEFYLSKPKWIKKDKEIYLYKNVI